MKKIFLNSLFISVLFILSGSISFAQEKRSTTVKVVKTVVVIVGQTAKIAGKTVQFAAPIALKITEKTTVLSFKITKTLVEKSFPVGRKLIVTYLKTKLPI